MSDELIHKDNGELKPLCGAKGHLWVSSDNQKVTCQKCKDKMKLRKAFGSFVDGIKVKVVRGS